MRHSSGIIVKDRHKYHQLVRKIEADSLLPPLQQGDDISINFRKVILEREELGFQRLSPRYLIAIRDKGYDAFFIDQMNSYTKIGLGLFHKLAAIDRLELTTEYIVFHHFREKLKPNCRRRIAILLVSKTKEAK